MDTTNPVYVDKVLHPQPGDIVIFRFSDKYSMFAYLEKEQIVDYMNKVSDALAQALPEGVAFIVLPSGADASVEKIRYGTSH